MYRSGLVDTLVTHANMKGLGLTPLFGDRRGFMPPQLKTKTAVTYLEADNVGDRPHHHSCTMLLELVVM